MARIEALLAGDGLDFHDQVRTAMTFGGFQAVISQYPEADAAELREALLDAAGALSRARPRRRQPATVASVQVTSEETHARA
jgi:hypothetical protein